MNFWCFVGFLALEVMFVKFRKSVMCISHERATKNEQDKTAVYFFDFSCCSYFIKVFELTIAKKKMLSAIRGFAKKNAFNHWVSFSP